MRSKHNMSKSVNNIIREQNSAKLKSLKIVVCQCQCSSRLLRIVEELRNLSSNGGPSTDAQQTQHSRTSTRALRLQRSPEKKSWTSTARKALNEHAAIFRFLENEDETIEFILGPSFNRGGSIRLNGGHRWC